MPSILAAPPILRTARPNSLTSGRPCSARGATRLALPPPSHGPALHTPGQKSAQRAPCDPTRPATVYGEADQLGVSKTDMVRAVPMGPKQRCEGESRCTEALQYKQCHRFSQPRAPRRLRPRQFALGAIDYLTIADLLHVLISLPLQTNRNRARPNHAIGLCVAPNRAALGLLQ